MRKRLKASLMMSLVLACAPLLSPRASRAEDARPKLVVFDLELDDFSAGGPLAGESPAETARLQKMSALARDLLAQSGLFELVDPRASANDSVKEHWLRKCNGCDAAAARALGADLSFVGYFRKISVMEQFLELAVRDARSGEIVNLSHTDLRNETDDSWARALTYLIRRRLIEPERARREGEGAR
jgi:hypothetical protein